MSDSQKSDVVVVQENQRTWIELFEKEMFSDVIFEVEKKKFSVHRVIISQSQFLEILASSAKTDFEQIPVIRLDDVKKEPFEQFLRFLYGDELNCNNVETLVDLFMLGQKYDVLQLDQHVLYALENNLKLSNIWKVLELAQQYKLNAIKNVVFGFILRNKNEVMDDIKQRQIDQQLMMEVMEVLVSKKQSPTKIVKPSMQLRIETIDNHVTQLFKSKKYCDITLVSSDGRKFQCHKIVLCLHSDYFNSMLSGQFKESKEEEVTMDEIDSSSMVSILEFIYTRGTKIPHDQKGLFNIIRVSDFLMLTKLRKKAVDKLTAHVTPQNAFDTIQRCVELNIEGKVKEACWKNILKARREDLIEMIIRLKFDHLAELANLQKHFEHQLKAFNDHIKAQKDMFEKQLKDQQEQHDKHITQYRKLLKDIFGKDIEQETSTKQPSNQQNHNEDQKRKFSEMQQNQHENPAKKPKLDNEQ